MTGILTSDLEEIVDPQKTPLTVEECLGEFNDGQKALARENLDVYDRNTVYTKQASDEKLNETIKKAFEKYLNEEDPHGILPEVRQMIEGFVRADGSTPFTAPQQGVDPIQDFHLATKRFVTKILRDHINDDDPHRVIPQVEDMLEQYVKQADVYFKSQLYTKNEIDQQSGKYIKKDGSTPFTKAQIGADPQIDSHLTTKRYVDQVIYNHLVDVDPHGFIAILNNRLATYAKTSNVYDKSQTYSKVQIDSIIRSLVHDAAREAIIDHLNEFDPHNILAEVRKEKYVKQDGTIPFRAPQKGVDAVDPQDLITLHQVTERIENLQKQITNNEPIWRTSGPVESTVGHIDDNTPVPEIMTLQEVLDAMFYGKGISISAPDYVTINNKVPVTLCIHGSIGLIDIVELYQDNKLIYSLVKEDFENGCITVNSLPIIEDTKFTFKVTYTNGALHEESITVKVALPTFVGLLPKWKFGHTITWEYLKELSLEEPNNNKFISNSDNLNQISMDYNFQDAKLRHPFVVVPVSYPNLVNMSTSSQKFGLEAFDIIDSIPLTVPGVEKVIVFKIYIYRQALSSLNQEITFNFA